MKRLLIVLVAALVPSTGFAVDYTVSTDAVTEAVLARESLESGSTKDKIVQDLVSKGLMALLATQDRIDAANFWALAKQASSGARQTAITNLGASITPPAVTAPKDQTSAANAKAELLVVATDTDKLPLSFKATGLPPGLAMNPDGGGWIAGTPTTPGKYAVTIRVQKLAGVFVDVSFTWIIE